MKTILFVVTLAMLINSSCRKGQSQAATIVRDCTGTYLKMNGKDYYVCNAGKIAFFPTGTTIDVSFKTTDECLSVNPPLCYMFHQNEGWIEVITIK